MLLPAHTHQRHQEAEGTNIFKRIQRKTKLGCQTYPQFRYTRRDAMSTLSRRDLIKTALSGVTAASLPLPSSGNGERQSAPVQRKGRIRQSVARWCYKDIPLDKLCAYGAEIGLKAVDLLNPDEYEVPARYGLVCSMGYASGGDIANALNRVENHAKIEEGFRKYIPLAAKAGVPNVITFSGNRNGMSDEEGDRKSTRLNSSHQIISYAV